MYNSITATPRKLAQLLKEACKRNVSDCIGCDLGNKFCTKYFEFYPEYWIFEDKEEGPRVETKEEKHDWEPIVKILEEGDIKRCPFCGGVAIVKERDYYNAMRVKCTVCGATGKEYEYNNQEEKNKTEVLAVEAWNMRA